MAKRSTTSKQVAALRKALTRSQPKAFVSVLDWMRLRGYATKRDEAVALVLSGRLRSADGTTLGILGEAGARYAAAFIAWPEAEGMYLIDEATNEAEKRAKIAEKEAEIKRLQAERENAEPDADRDAVFERAQAVMKESGRRTFS